METARWTLGKMQNPIRGLLHGSAAVASAIASAFLVSGVSGAGTWQARLGVLVFGAGLVALFTTSSLYHSVPWRQAAKQRMQRLDHSMIFVLIAGTYTPIALVVFDAPLRGIVLGLVWGVATVGILQKAFLPHLPTAVSIAMSTTLGWVAVLFAWPMVQRLALPGLMLVAAGGILYTIGMVFLVTNRPRLWPRVFSYHEVFHVLVVIAGSLHFVAIWRYVVPLAS